MAVAIGGKERLGGGAMSGLPEGWADAQLHQITADEPAAITDGPFGSNLKTVHYTDSGARVVRLNNLGDGRFKDADQSFISLDQYRQLTKHEVRAGDLITAALGDPLGRTCIAPTGN